MADDTQNRVLKWTNFAKSTRRQEPTLRDFEREGVFVVGSKPSFRQARQSLKNYVQGGLYGPVSPKYLLLPHHLRFYLMIIIC